MPNLRIAVPNALLKRRNMAMIGAGVLALVLSAPPGFAADAKEAPMSSQETAAASNAPQSTSPEPPPQAQNPATTQESPAAAQESPPAQREPPPSPGDSAVSTSSAPAEQARGKDASRSLEQRRLHRAQMRLSGSTCLSCLMALERKLKEVPGIAKVKIERADQTHFEFQGAPGINYSEATITYDVGQVALSEIVAFMKAHGYHAYKIVDKDKG